MVCQLDDHYFFIPVELNKCLYAAENVMYYKTPRVRLLNASQKVGDECERLEHWPNNQLVKSQPLLAKFGHKNGKCY